MQEEGWGGGGGVEEGIWMEVEVLPARALG